MKSIRTKVALCVATAAGLGVGAMAVADGGGRGIKERLSGYEEVPALSTTGSGQFRAQIDRRRDEIEYRLSWRGLESPVTQAHIHFENETNNGPIVVFLCANVGTPPAGTQPCPTGTEGSIRGTIEPEDVGGGAAAQGLAAGEFDEFVRAVRAGATYVNVHSTIRTGGEIRAQLEHDHDRRRGNDD